MKKTWKTLAGLALMSALMVGCESTQCRDGACSDQAACCGSCEGDCGEKCADKCAGKCEGKGECCGTCGGDEKSCCGTCGGEGHSHE